MKQITDLKNLNQSIKEGATIVNQNKQKIEEHKDDMKLIEMEVYLTVATEVNDVGKLYFSNDAMRQAETYLRCARNDNWIKLKEQAKTLNSETANQTELISFDKREFQIIRDEIKLLTKEE